MHSAIINTEKRQAINKEQFPLIFNCHIDCRYFILRILKSQIGESMSLKRIRFKESVSKFGGFFTAVGLPISHVFGYIGTIIALPTIADRKTLHKGFSIIIPSGLFVFYWLILACLTPDKVLAFKSVLNYTAHWFLPLCLGLVCGKWAIRYLRTYTAIIALIVLFGAGSALGIFPGVIFGEKVWADGMLWGFHHHNALAAMILLVTPLSMALGKSFEIVAVVLLGGVIMSGSRGYFLTVPLVIVGIFTSIHKTLRQSDRILFFIIIALVVVGLAISIAPGPRNRIISLISGSWRSDLAATSRFGFWQVGHYAFMERPIFGIGPGQLPSRTDFLDKLEQDHFKIDLRGGKIVHLHNFYLTILAEGGIIGLMLILWTLVALGRKLSKSGKLGHALLWGLSAILLGNLFDSQLRGPSVAIDLFFIAGMIIALHYDHEKAHNK